MQKMKSKRLNCDASKGDADEYEHLIYMKAKSERLICRRRSLNVSTAMSANVMQMKSEHLIHMKVKSEHLICRR